MLKYGLDYFKTGGNIDKIRVESWEGRDAAPSHIHEFIELVFIAQGSGIHYVDDTKYEVKMGDLLFINYQQTHSFSMSDDSKYYNLLYLPQFFGEEIINSENIYDIFQMSLFKEFAHISETDLQKVHFFGDEYIEVRSMIEKMKQEFTQQKTGYGSILSGYSRVLFSRVLRKLDGALNGLDKKAMMDKKIVSECLDIVNKNCFGKISMNEIAQRMFYNPSYLSRVFKKYCGMSFSKYIKEKRMEEAARLLKETDISVEKIMNQVGYEDGKRFYEKFKEIYELTPNEYRKQS